MILTRTNRQTQTGNSQIAVACRSRVSSSRKEVANSVTDAETATKWVMVVKVADMEAAKEVRAVTKEATEVMEAEEVVMGTRTKGITRVKVDRIKDTKTRVIQEDSTLDTEEATHSMVGAVTNLTGMAEEILNQEEAVEVAELPRSTRTT